MPACLDTSIGIYKRLGDGLMLTRTHLLKAKIAAADPAKAGEEVAQLNRATKDCEEQRCISIRRRALKSLAYAHWKQNDSESAAKAMMAEARAGAPLMPADQRAFARTAEVEKLCAALDKRDGPGACRKLEKLGLRRLHLR